MASPAKASEPAVSVSDDLKKDTPKAANSISDNDSVIEDSEAEDFTSTVKYMKGAPMPYQLKEIVRD